MAKKPLKLRWKMLIYSLKHERKFLLSKFLYKTHALARPEWSAYWNDAEDNYSRLNVKDKLVYDIGCDYGVTPTYFLRNGATQVVGFSLDRQVFHTPNYSHYIGWTAKQMMESKANYNGQRCALKMDCEGLEWQFSQEWVEQFDDWVICCHYPVQNEKLFDWIKSHGENIGHQGETEFAIYKKKTST